MKKNATRQQLVSTLIPIVLRHGLTVSKASDSARHPRATWRRGGTPRRMRYDGVPDLAGGSQSYGKWRRPSKRVDALPRITGRLERPTRRVPHREADDQSIQTLSRACSGVWQCTR